MREVNQLRAYTRRIVPWRAKTPPPSFVRLRTYLLLAIHDSVATQKETQC